MKGLWLEGGIFDISPKVLGSLKGGTHVLCDATAVNGSQWPLECKFHRIMIAMIEIRIQRCIDPVFIRK